MDELKIVYLPPEELTPYEGNARLHTREDIEAIKASIRESGGFYDPIGVWGPDNIIVEGHGRRQAAMEMGIKQLPCIRLDKLTDKQRRYYCIAHNRSTELSRWDINALEKELGSNDMLDFDLTSIGFLSVNNQQNKHEEGDMCNQKGNTYNARATCCPRCGSLRVANK